jgi:hypothetical protein
VSTIHQLCHNNVGIPVLAVVTFKFPYRSIDPWITKAGNPSQIHGRLQDGPDFEECAGVACAFIAVGLDHVEGCRIFTGRELGGEEGFVINRILQMIHTAR